MVRNRNTAAAKEAANGNKSKIINVGFLSRRHPVVIRAIDGLRPCIGIPNVSTYQAASQSVQLTVLEPP